MSFDNLLLLSYKKWKDCVVKYYNKLLSDLLITLEEYNIILNIRELIKKNPNISTISDIKKLTKVNSEKVDQICSKYNIKKLIESDININLIKKEILEIQKIINDIDNFIITDISKLL